MGGFMAGHLLRHFELAAVLQVCGNAGRAEAVAVELDLNAGGNGPPLNHHVHVRLCEWQASR